MALGYHQDLYQDSISRFTNYAKSIEADYLCIHKGVTGLNPTYERFQLFEERFDIYDNILYVDADAIPKLNAPNIFDLCDGSSLYAYPEGGTIYNNIDETRALTNGQPLSDVPSVHLAAPDEIKHLSQYWRENRYFNAGIAIYGKKARQQIRQLNLRSYMEKRFSLKDQSALNIIVEKHNIPYIPLSYKFNGIFSIYKDKNIVAKVLKSCHFVHFCSSTKNFYPILKKYAGDNWQLEELSELQILSAINEWHEIFEGNNKSGNRCVAI